MSEKMGSLKVVIEPQPEHGISGIWFYDNDVYVSDEEMQDHLFHNVYGEKGTPLGSLWGDGSGDSVTITGTQMEIADVTVELVRDVWVWAVELKEQAK